MSVICNIFFLFILNINEVDANLSNLKRLPIAFFRNSLACIIAVFSSY